MSNTGQHLQTEKARKANIVARAMRSDVGAMMKKADLDNTAADNERIAFRLTQMPVNCRTQYLSAMKGTSRQDAIHAHCRMCIGWTRGEVSICTDPACPLFPYREDW